MKKMLFTFAMLMTMVAAISVSASTQSDVHSEQDHLSCATHVSVEGTHCDGTVGCSCPGFSPITNGEVWQRDYCRHCNHKRSVHK